MKNLLFLTSLCLLARTSFAQCSGFQIVANKTSVCAPDIIRFQVLNPVAGSTYEWNVGNGIVFGADTLYSFYNTAGTIDASVKITLANGSVCTVTNNAIAVVNPLPVPVFQASEVKLCYGADSVEFTDLTPNSVSRSWVIQGTNYGNTGKSIKHNFISPGSKKVTLVVTDDKGCKGVKEFLDTIQIFDDPTFSFTTDKTSGCVPLDVNLSMVNNPSVAPYTKSYNWTFSGHPNNTSSLLSPGTRTYANEGKYPVSLEVSVSNGCNYVIEQNDTIVAGDTTLLGLQVPEDTICVGGLLTFNQTNTSLTGNLDWEVSGVWRHTISESNTQLVINPTRRGNVNLQLSYNNNGCISTKNFPNIARVDGVKAGYSSLNNFHCNIPHTVDITNNSQALDANSLTYDWSVLEGSTEIFNSTSQDPSFTFNTMPGYYDVKLVVTGDNGCQDSILKPNFIYQDSLRLDFDVLPKIACVGQQVQVQNLTPPSTYLHVDSFDWKFFDKNGVTVFDSSDIFNPTVIYSDTGFFDIEVIGFNDAGCRDTFRLNDIIEVISTDLDYSLSDSILCRDLSFSLQGLSLPSDASYSYNWSFEHLSSGNIYNRTGKSTSISPPLIGEYEVIVSQNIAGACFTSDTTTIHVNGIEAQIELDTLNGCAPLLVHPTVNITNDYFIGQTDSAYSYLWTVAPNNGITENNVTTDTPSFGFTENGDYFINLAITNSASCSASISSPKVLTGVRSGYTIVDNRICFGDSLEVIDNSFNGVTDAEWSITPSSPFTLTEDSEGVVKFLISQPGSYILRQIVTNRNNCFDTTFSPFEIIETIANFEAVDSFLQCAPIYAEFVSKSSYADSLIWNFGTGETFTTTSSSAGTIYQRNSGWGEGYDITLIAKNNEGCTDTFVREDYLVVAGPTADFEMENFVGCEPLEVKFTNKSIDETEFYLNYNDGSTLDSTQVGDVIGYNQYSLQSPTAMRQAILPSMIVYDSLGCAAYFEPADSIIVFRSPKIEPVFDNGTELCAPFNVVFEDTGSFAESRSWTLDGIEISTGSKDSVLKSAAGSHSLQLTVSNSNNCFDTIVQPINVFEKPTVSFIKEDTICLNNTVLFSGDIQSSNVNDNFRWTFGEPANPSNTNTTDLNPSFTYTSKGTKTIKLFAGLNNGCADSSEASIVITDETDIDAPEIDYVSFTSNYELEVIYNKSNNAKFRNYFLNNSQGDIEIYDIDKTTYTTSFATAPLIPDCYTLSVGDYCDLRGANSTSHCFIVLSSTSVRSGVNELNWTAYQGWTAVKEYKIFKKDENDVFERIATVDGSITTFEDTSLCSADYEYYVAAVHPTETWESNSYRVIQRPLYDSNEVASSIKNVTVAGENVIEVTWDSSEFSGFNSYKLYKYETSFNNLIDEIDLQENRYIDTDVSTNEFSYIYLLAEQDVCGNLNSSDKEGKSILLKGEYNNGSSLYWTKYENWERGVKRYNVEINKLGNFEFTHRNDSHDRDYIDKKLYRDITGEYCYRVYATSEFGDTSYSNVTCLSGEPKMHIPNAFSPNNDGLNDKFNPIMYFMKEGELEEINGFSLTIFNRWGEKIFETNDPRSGWDGVYKGNLCQPGAYVYSVKATGLDNFKLFKDGTITIVR